jgi:hypothetical protein
VELVGVRLGGLSIFKRAVTGGEIIESVGLLRFMIMDGTATS